MVGFLFQEVSWCSRFLPTLFYGRPPPGYGCVHVAFLYLHSPWCLGLSSLRGEVGILPHQCAHSPVGARGLRPTPTPTSCALSQPPPCFRFGLGTPHTSAGVRDGWVAQWRGAWSCCCRGILKRTPQGLFLFGKILLLNPVAPSMQGRACPLAQPTSPARLTLSGSGPTWPNSQLSPASVPLSVGLPLHPYSLP